MKIIPQSGVQFYFGNKVDRLLYEGVNIYQNHDGRLQIEVLGNTVMMSVRCGDSNLFIVWLTIYWYGSNSI